jgi:UDP-glucuronate decarboxylase
MLGLVKRVEARIPQASTSEDYGGPEVHPRSEDYRGHVNPIGPRSCYYQGRRCAEKLYFDYHPQYPRLGWQPAAQREKGLKRAIAYFKAAN